MRVKIYQRIVNKRECPSNSDINGSIKSQYKKLINIVDLIIIPRIDDKFRLNDSDYVVTEIGHIIDHNGYIPETSQTLFIVVEPYIPMKFNYTTQKNEEYPIILNLETYEGE